MKKVVSLQYRFISINTPESEERLQRACNRIFNIAKQNLLSKKIKRKEVITNG